MDKIDKIAISIILSIVIFICGLFAGGILIFHANGAIDEFQNEAVARGFAEYSREDNGKAIFNWKEPKNNSDIKK